MDNISMILSGLLSIAIVLWLGPSVLRMNKGKILQNMAAWLAIFCVLGLAYKTIGPGKDIIPPTEQNQETVLPEGSPNFLTPRS